MQHEQHYALCAQDQRFALQERVTFSAECAFSSTTHLVDYEPSQQPFQLSSLAQQQDCVS